MTENTGQDEESPMQVEHFLLYGEERLSFRLVRRGTARGSIRIAVTPQGEILVTADASTPLEVIEDALQQRVRWLLETRERFQAQRVHALPRRFVGGETHFYLGRRHQLRIVDESEGKHVRLLRGRLVVPSRYPWSEEPAVLASRTEEIRRRLEAWYRQRAEEVLPQYFERMLPLVPWADRPPLRLVRMKARWGSCTPQGVVLLNPDLVRAPRHCIEYVI
ncbi:MAG: YgjP-like metallopeptidase domain-containing protein, partial [Desulfovibrio piger]|uniref:M48 family metallopeptidase n=1 Tax=Desulfovibrio piger TaxID=901 RepID=UPI002A83D80B